MLVNKGQIHSLCQMCLMDFIKQNIRNFHTFLECPLHLLKFLLKGFSFKNETFRSLLTFYKKQKRHTTNLS